VRERGEHAPAVGWSGRGWMSSRTHLQHLSYNECCGCRACGTAADVAPRPPLASRRGGKSLVGPPRGRCQNRPRLRARPRDEEGSATYDRRHRKSASRHRHSGEMPGKERPPEAHVGGPPLELVRRQRSSYRRRRRPLGPGYDARGGSA
jgi:hypothetical protein